MNPPKNRENTITRYRIIEENLVGEVKEPKENYDLLSAVMLCLGDPDGDHYGGVLKLLDVLFSKESGASEKRQILEEDFCIPMTQNMESEVSQMCNLSDGVERRGIAKGHALGMTEGMNKGRALGMTEGINKGKSLGKTEGFYEAIRSLMLTTGWPVDQAMSALQIPETDRQKYLDLLNN